MIKKYNNFLNEKLSDKLTGFNVNELKQQFLKGKINLDNYFNICRKYNLEFPTKEEIFKKLKSSRYSPINLLVKSSEYGCLEGIKLSIEKGVDIEKYLKRILNDAILHEYNDILEFIIDNYDIPSDELYSSFQLLVNMENIDMIKYFINKKIKIDENTLKHALYDASTNKCNIEIVKILISMGAIVYEYIIDNCYDNEIKELLQKYYDKNKIFKKHNEYINEKISDKLSGFDSEEILNQFLNKKINIYKYIFLVEKYKINLPNKETFKQYVSDGKISMKNYNFIIKYFHLT